MIFYLLAVLLIVYSFVDFKKSFILFLGFKMFLNTNITLISIPGIPILTLDLAITLFYVLNIFFHHGKYQHAKKAFPFRIAFFLLFICWTISSLFAIAGFTSESSVLLKNVVNKILFIWMLWQMIETKEDFVAAFKIITVVFFASTIYGFYELSTSSNPLFEFEKTLNHDTEKVINWSYAESGRGYRINSLFEHAIGAGMNWGLYAAFTLGLLIKKSRNIPWRSFSLITAILCVVCMFFSRSRTPLIFFVISIVGMFDFKKRRTYGWILLFIISLVFIVPNLSINTIQMIKSIFDSSIDVGGSSLISRLDQVSAAFSIMSESIIFGLGSKYSLFVNSALVQRILGGESVWLGVIPSYGLFGIICYFFEMVTMIYVIPRNYRSKELFFLGFAYWTANTVSSFPGFLEYLYFLSVFYFIKQSNVYSVKEQKEYKLYFEGFKIHYIK